MFLKFLHYISLDFTENLDFQVNFTVKGAYFRDISYVCIVNYETIFLLHEPSGCIKINHGILSTNGIGKFSNSS